METSKMLGADINFVKYYIIKRECVVENSLWLQVKIYLTFVRIIIS